MPDKEPASQKLKLICIYIYRNLRERERYIYIHMRGGIRILCETLAIIIEKNAQLGVCLPAATLAWA